MGLPCDDLKQCLEIACTAPANAIDVGRANKGLLDLAVIKDATGGELMRLSQELETPDNPDNKVLRYWQLPEFTIEAEREVHFNLDGEPTTEHQLHFSVLPKHLRVAF